MASSKKSILSEKFKKWAKTKGEFNFRDMINEEITLWRGYAIILTDRGIREGWLHKIEAVPAEYINHTLVSEAIPTRFRWSETDENREQLIEKIEGYTGSLRSIPWHSVSTEDIVKLYNTLRR